MEGKIFIVGVRNNNEGKRQVIHVFYWLNESNYFIELKQRRQLTNSKCPKVLKSNEEEDMLVGFNEEGNVVSIKLTDNRFSDIKPKKKEFVNRGLLCLFR